MHFTLGSLRLLRPPLVVKSAQSVTLLTRSLCFVFSLYFKCMIISKYNAEDASVLNLASDVSHNTP